MSNRRIRLGLSALAGLLVIGLAGCSDDPAGPSGTAFDPENTAQSVAGLQSELNTDSDVMIGLELVAPAIAAEGGVPSIALPDRLDGPVGPVSAEVAYSYVLSGSSAPIFPSNLLGKTFEWNADLGRYAVGTRTGAPANGVRFILYAMDPLTRQPVLPLVETGLLDLTDESDATATRLGVHAESGGATLVEYFIQASFAVAGQTVSVTLDAVGFFSDGTLQLDFDLSQTALVDTVAETIALDIDYQLSVAGQDVSVRLVLSGEASFASEGGPETATVTLNIDHGTDHVVMSAELAADNTIDGVINYNGAPAILIGGTEADPVFTRPDAEPLTAQDVAALHDLFDMIEDVFDFAENLFEPFDDGF